MTTAVFLGPSLPREEAASIAPDSQWWPPAQAGDLYRAVKHRGVSTIGLIDGVFGTAPSVWHKEILYALTRGVRILGSSSMGALRAAECAPFGMRGVGEVFQAYASGDLVDDDEVAVEHLDEAGGFAPVTVPMVTVRKILSLAQQAGAISEVEKEDIAGRCKSIFYADRSWETLRDVLHGCVSDTSVDHVWNIAHSRESDPKAQDARMLLELIAQPARPQDAPAQRVAVEDTAFWTRLKQEVDLPAVTPWFVDAGAGIDVNQRVNIVRGALLEPAHSALGVRPRLWVHLVEECCDQLGIVASREDIQRKSEELRREQGLLDASATREWLARQAVTAAEWQWALEFEVKLDKLTLEFSSELRRHIPHLVALRGGWRKHERLAGAPGQSRSWEEQTTAVTELIQRGQLPVARDMDELVARLGFTSLTELLNALDRERDG